MSDSYFPIKIIYTDAPNKPIIIKSPAELDSGRGFKVLETKVIQATS